MILPVVITDDREKHPMHHLDGTYCTYSTARLSVGDYALESMCAETPGRKTLTPRFAIERKSIPDWLSSWHGKVRRGKRWTDNRAREIAKILKAQRLGFNLMYVLDGNEKDIEKAVQREPWKRKGLTARQVMYYIAYLRAQGIHVITSPTRLHAEIAILNLLNAARKKETGVK